MHNIIENRYTFWFQDSVKNWLQWKMKSCKWRLIMQEYVYPCMFSCCFWPSEEICQCMKSLLWGRLASVHKLYPVTIQLLFHFLHALWPCCCTYYLNTTASVMLQYTWMHIPVCAGPHICTCAHTHACTCIWGRKIRKKWSGLKKRWVEEQWCWFWTSWKKCGVIIWVKSHIS